MLREPELWVPGAEGRWDGRGTEETRVLEAAGRWDARGSGDPEAERKGAELAGSRASCAVGRPRGVPVPGCPESLPPYRAAWAQRRPLSAPGCPAFRPGVAGGGGRCSSAALTAPCERGGAAPPGPDPPGPPR